MVRGPQFEKRWRRKLSPWADPEILTLLLIQCRSVRNLKAKADVYICNFRVFAERYTEVPCACLQK